MYISSTQFLFVIIINISKNELKVPDISRFFRFITFALGMNVKYGSKSSLNGFVNQLNPNHLGEFGRFIFGGKNMSL